MGCGLINFKKEGIGVGLISSNNNNLDNIINSRKLILVQESVINREDIYKNIDRLGENRNSNSSILNRNRIDRRNIRNLEERKKELKRRIEEIQNNRHNTNHSRRNRSQRLNTPHSSNRRIIFGTNINHQSNNFINTESNRNSNSNRRNRITLRNNRGTQIETRNRNTNRNNSEQNKKSNAILSKLPINKIDDINRLKGENKKCSICLQHFKKMDSAIYLPCFHLFHKKCITKWLDNKEVCPLCKLNINEFFTISK